MFAFRYIASFLTSANAERHLTTNVTTNLQIEASSSKPKNLVLDDQKPSSPVRINRENGYGDFCFDSVAMRNEKFEREKKRNTSGSCKVVEKSRPRGGVLRREVMEDIIKIGFFPLMKLPIEIRERIYRWVAMPYNYDGEQKFDIRLQRHYQVTPFTMQFYGGRFQDNYASMDLDLGALRSRRELISEYQRKQADFRQHFASHPERESNYLFATNVKLKMAALTNTKNSAEEDKWSIEWKREVSAEAIRNLSNVSCHVRNELGRVLWRNVYIECDDYCHEQLVGFLMERPAIHRGIKSLKTSISIETEDHKLRIQNMMKFYSFCDYLSANLTLGTLQVYLHFDFADCYQIARCEGRFAFLVSLRDINVQKTFCLNGLMYVNQKKYGKPSVTKVMAMLRKELKPYSFMRAEPITEQEVYLQGRKELVHGFKKHEQKMSQVVGT